MNNPYPLLLEPVYKHYPWGGDRILTTYGRSAPPGIYAESWEVADRSDGMSVVRNGALSGTPLSAVVAAWGRDLLGAAAPEASGPFPLLVKILDARHPLSVQVHPDDAAAARFGGEAKTELWYLLGDAPGACVYSGFQEGFGPEDFHAAVQSGTLEQALQQLPVRSGQAVFIPAGRVHAIGSGCLLLEIQQNSNTTYRIFDWGRLGDDGRPRDLHLAQAAQVIDWSAGETALVKPIALDVAGGRARKQVLRCPFFSLEQWRLSEAWEEKLDGQSFRIFFVATGSVHLRWGNEDMLSLSAGTSVLVPASLGSCRLEPAGGDCEVLSVSL